MVNVSGYFQRQEGMLSCAKIHLIKYGLEYTLFPTQGYRDVWSELIALGPWAGLVRGWGLICRLAFLIWFRLAGCGSGPRPGGETLLRR